MIKFIAAAATAALLATGATAQTKTVSYADLDLASAAGAKAFDARIRAAARSVCGTADLRDIVATKSAQRCFETAVAKAKSTAA